MANSALGSALIIPESALEKIKEADEKLEKIKVTAEQTASSVKDSFKTMQDSTNGLISKLDQIISKLGVISVSASNAGSGLGNLGQNLGNIDSRASSTVQNMSNLINQMSNIGGKGSSSVMQAVAAFNRLQEASRGASGMNIAQLTAEIDSINTKLKDTENLLTKNEQDALVKRRSLLQGELKEQQKTYEERVLSFQKAIDKMLSAESTFNSKQKKKAEERAKNYRDKNNQRNTSYVGSLTFANSANTINRMTTAVSYLNTAKKQLSTTDKNYEAKVQTLDAKIHSLTLTIRQLSMTTEQRLAAQKAVNMESEKEANKALKEEAANQKRIQSLRSLNAEMNRQKNYEKNTSFSGSLKFADTANTYNRQAKAVEYLNTAKRSLSQTDSDYQAKLIALNSKIESLTRSMKEAMRTSEQIADAQKKANNSIDFSKSVSDWQNIQAQINTTNKRQQELTQSMRQYELTLQRIRDGKGGVIRKEDQTTYVANQKEFETNKQLIASLREKQQAIIANNHALNQQAQILNSLKNYKHDSGSLDNLRSKDTLAAMREYYKELEKLSAKQAKEAEAEAKARQKKAEAEAKAAEKEAKAEEKAEQKKREEWAKSTAAYSQQYHNERQAMYNRLFSPDNSTASTALAYSSNAKTLRDHVAAIKELQQARLNLDTTDKNYKQNLASVNEAIKQHSKVLQEAGVNAKALGEKTSYMEGYLSRWAQRMAFAFSVDSIKNFVGQIAEVRGQFELSERSLEAILQNKSKADEIFNKTVELAVKSPFRIKDLVDYTRQLSAYRIESDKLYDTTKRLADVSAGLGVDMGRLILAYGQVKAAAYLRGSEVRQFTEAGINMYGELQQYFKEVKGEAYTTAQIVDMISKRKVTFEDVETIFQRMTDKGGTFYNMQEIQAETLQGKISNLKDAFDVMLNDIGKANEGTFKGLINGATVLLNNWKAIEAVVKALTALLILLKIQSIETGVGLSKVFSLSAVGNATKNLSFLQLMKNGLKSAGDAALTFGKNLKTAIASNVWLIAIAAVVQTLWSVGEAVYDYYKKTKEAQEETIKAQGAIDGIAVSYNQLAKSASNANSKLAGEDLEKNIEDRRAQLQKLIDLAEKDGLTFNINVADIKEENLDKEFNEVKKKYKDFVDEIEVIEKNYAANNNWDNWFTDGLDDDAGDYKDAVIDILSMSSRMEQAVAVINSNYDKATQSTKKYFDEIRAGQKDGESNLDYWRRMSGALQQINRASTGSDYLSPQWASSVQNNISDMIQGFMKVDSKARELNKEFDAVFGDLRTKYKNNPVQIQAIIDKTAAKHDWSQYERDLAYQHFGIYVSINKSSMKKEANWVDDYLTNFFAKKKYGINLVVKEITDDKGLEDFIAKGDAAAKAAKNWAEVEKRLLSVGKNQKTIKIDDSIRKIFKSGDPRVAGTEIDVSVLRDMLNEYKKAATGTAKSLGVDPFEKDNKKNKDKKEKAQRDILQERISLLKDMNSKYNELIKTESKETALSKTRKYFKEAAQNVGWKASDILPDDKSVAKRVREIGSQYKELSKRGNAYRISADIDLKVSEKEYNELKDDISRNIDDAFSQLQLYKKLKGEGLSEEIIKSMFGDIASSFMDVQYKIDEEFNKYIIKEYETKHGKDFTKWGDKVLQQYNSELADTEGTLKKRFTGSDILKEYLEKKQKLNQQVNQDSVSQAQELIKAYKQQLSDQLQLDKWYIEEKNKLQTNAEISKNPELQKQLLDNLDKQYEQKTDANTWKDFQDSDMYIAIFENLDHTSSRVLKAIKERLAGLRSELKGLSPEQVKQIVNEIEKIDELLVERNPYKNIGKNFNNYLDFAKKRKRLEEEYIKAEEREEELKKQAENANKNVLLSQKAYNAVKEKYGEESKEAQQAGILLACNKANLEIILSQLEAQKKITEEQAEQIRNGQKVGKTLQDQLQQIGTNISDVANSVSSMFDMMNDWGINVEMSDELSEVVSGIDKIGSSLSSIDLSRPFSVISGTVGVLGGIGKTLGGIFGWGTKDKKLQNGIEEHQKAIEKLQDAYNDLKEAMDNAYDIAKLSKYNDEMVENLKKQNTYLESMIKAEQDKKKTDDEKIEEYRKQIEENNKAIKEIQQSLTEQLGGFGGDSNYKSAAEAFADAWVDAFNEGSDALEALNDKFDEYFNNLLKKQIMLRASEKYIKPILKAIDDAVSEGSEGGENGMELTEGEIAQIKKLKDENLAAYNEYVKGVMKAMGVSPTGGSNISALQQGIQSVTESTAQALESVLNSVRYYVATQQADIRIIRDTLLERLGTAINAVQQDTSSSPVLIELRLQTTILTDIRDTLSSCVKGGHRQGRNGIKVFMN